MSEQPKPLSAEEEGLLRNLVSRSSPGPWRERYAYLKHPPGTLIAATAPGHQVVSDEPGGTMPSADLAFIAAARIGVVRLFATLDAERARADAAEKSCEDWQDCASHLVLAIKSQFHEESRTDEMRVALAEFDRLASEAAKGVEF